MSELAEDLAENRSPSTDLTDGVRFELLPTGRSSIFAPRATRPNCSAYIETASAASNDRAKACNAVMDRRWKNAIFNGRLGKSDEREVKLSEQSKSSRSGHSVRRQGHAVVASVAFAARPKQFLAADRRFEPVTRKRCSGSTIKERYAAPIVITNDEYRFLVAEQAQECGVALEAILLEPVARNTAAAIAAAAFVDRRTRIRTRSCTSYPRITRSPSMRPISTAVATAAALPPRDDNRLTTFGITPSEPATGFGYIEGGKLHCLPAPWRFRRFVEKPDPGKCRTDAGRRQLLLELRHVPVSRPRSFSTECEKLAPGGP